MMCFKDMTFCPFWEDCTHGDVCKRAFTPELKAEAKKWMDCPPICYYSEKPKCWKEKADEN